MKFTRIFLNRLQDQPSISDTVVVIDVLRSFTTAAVALAQGARAIYPVEGISSAVALLDRLPDALSVGAIAGGDPIPGFHFGNSPAALLASDLADKDIVLSTAAGVRGLQRFRRARRLFAASLVCARATAKAIRTARAREVCFVITGEWVDRDGDEDIACADYIEQLLSTPEAPAQQYAQRVYNSDFGRRFLSGDWPHLPQDDLHLAADVDRYDFAMPVRQENDQLVIRGSVIRASV